MLNRLFDSGLPGRASRALGRVADVPLPKRVLGAVITAYSAAVGVDARDYEEPPGGFATFGDFFARRLKPGARPVPAGADAFVSPCDGALEAVFEANAAGSAIHVKGSDYSPDELLGARGEGQRFAGGGGIVVYLHPRDYHRVHAPCGGDLVRVRHIPGTRFPVAPWSERRVARLYQKNERVAFFFDLPGGGALALVMVAAMGVGDIASPHAPTPAPSEQTTRALAPRVPLIAGDEIGAFRLGSTVVVLWSGGAVSLDPGAGIGRRVLMGQRLGKAGPVGS